MALALSMTAPQLMAAGWEGSDSKQSIGERLTDSLTYKVEAQVSLSTGDNTPLWLNANKYGLSSLKTANGYMRMAVERPLLDGDDHKWEIAYGADIVVPVNYTSKFFVQQLYGEVRWLHGALTIGQKEQPLQLKNQRLSTGSQTFGINARPVPQVRLSLPDYWVIPILNRWLSIKGHIAYGMCTDGKWQENFVKEGNRYTKNTLYHGKAGYLRIGKPEYYPVSFEAGVEMACIFGGTLYNVGTNSGFEQKIDGEKDLKAFWSALVFAGDDIGETDYANVAGDQLGSWVARLNFNYDDFALSFYYDHYFEDHSQVAQFDYDGYGVGEEWMVKKKKKYHIYKLKDMMLGIDLKLKNARLLNNIVAEYIYTKYQSSSVYHDHTYNLSDHIAGIDNYYNHYLYAGGWQHWGQVMGNPLYLSPIYQDGELYVANNRFVAFHLGLAGDPTENLNYRFLATWQKGWGTYESPYVPRRTNISLMAETTYSFDDAFLGGGWSVKGALGWDHGKIYGNNFGGQLTITKRGLIPTKKNKENLRNYR